MYVPPNRNPPKQTKKGSTNVRVRVISSTTLTLTFTYQLTNLQTCLGTYLNA